MAAQRCDWPPPVGTLAAGVPPGVGRVRGQVGDPDGQGLELLGDVVEGRVGHVTQDAETRDATTYQAKTRLREPNWSPCRWPENCGVR